MSSPYPDLAQFDTPEFKRYVEAHKHPNGEGDGRPTAFQIIKDEGLEGNLLSSTTPLQFLTLPGKLTDRTFLITGCSAGLGLEAARVLKTTGARLFVTARNLDKGREALGDILEPGKVDLLHLELGPFASVRKCAAEFLEASGGKLNILIR